jgi:threonylcarbamoyladenosine tRNA methylthiotransferase MtaB
MKIFLDSIGCRLNQSEIETIARHFVLSGHEITPDPAQADVTVINTCSVTAAAASDSRGKIRGAQRAGCPTILVTGCWSNIEPQAAENLPGVHDVIRNADKEYLVRDFLSLTPEVFDSILADEQPRQALPGRQQRTRAFIKAQDGCDNHCTYCVTRIARGEPHSTPQAQVLRDIRIAEKAGVKEVVLTGVHLASWGQDLNPTRHLSDLVQAVLAETSVPRVRLSSVEPWDLTPAFFTLFENDRLCPHLHLPLQSGSDSVLRRMARRITIGEFAGLVAEARSVVPDIAITTDIIVGFPGETEQEFQESLAFVSAMGFADGHVFSFSPRKGTPAAGFKPQLPNDVKKERNAVMRAVLARSAQQYRQPFIGQTREVLWESAQTDGQDWHLSGLTRNYLRVEAVSPDNRWNQLDRVILRDLQGDTFTGEIAVQA